MKHAATENGVLVTNTPGLSKPEGFAMVGESTPSRRFARSVVDSPGVNPRAVAGHAITLLLTVRRQLLGADRAVRAGNGDEYDVVTDELRADIVGLYGYGDIGSEVANLVAGLGAACFVYDPHVDDDTLPAHLTNVESIGALFERSDAVSIHAPLTAEARTAISEAELRSLSPSGILVNTAKAEIVDREALVSSLDSGAIACAGIDVFADGQPSADHPLFEYENVGLTPHIGTQTTEVLTEMSSRSAENVRAAFDGTVPETTINGDELA